MKKIGEYTARGIVTEDQTVAGTPQQIPLFDGSFKTAYRVKEFKIWGSSFGGGSEADVMGKLSKNDDGVVTTANFLRADDDNQIACASSQADTEHFINAVSIIDPDNLIVEDLYVYVKCRGTSSNAVNYLVIMEKYEITDWQGALAMARDRAQGDVS